MGEGVIGLQSTVNSEMFDDAAGSHCQNHLNDARVLNYLRVVHIPHLQLSIRSMPSDSAVFSLQLVQLPPASHGHRSDQMGQVDELRANYYRFGNPETALN